LLGALGVLGLFLVGVPWRTLGEDNLVAQISMIAGGLLLIGVSLVPLAIALVRTNRKDAGFFTVALTRADERLRALAVRVSGTYRSGVTDWLSYSYGFGRFTSPDGDSAVTGAGPSVHFSPGGSTSR
jgi:hypothetical protein